MGIVKVSDEIHEQLRRASKAYDRSLNGQAEHWLKIGLLAEMNPRCNYQELRDLLLLHEDLTLDKFVKKVSKK